MAGNIFWMLEVGFLFVVVLYVVSFVVGISICNSIVDFASEIINQNLVIGAIAKQSAYVV